MGVSQSRPVNRIRDAEWVRFAAEDDILSLDATPPDQIVPSTAVEEKNDSDEDEDYGGGGSYCNYCCSYNHNDDECPLLNPSLAAADSKNAHKGPTILSSQDASLMEGLIEDDIVRTSFLVSLSSDLLKQTESEKSPFSSVLSSRVNLLDTLHQALTRSRNAARKSKEVPNPSEMTFVSLIQAQSSEETINKGGLNSPNASLLLQMCVELLKSSMQISAENPICVKILDTLQQVLANPLPLSLCSNPETSEFASNVVDFLISVSSASEAAGANPSAQVKAMQKRAVMLLLHLILQMGSLLTALKTVKLLGLKTSSSESYLSEAEYRSFFSTFVRLKPSIGINPSLNSTTPHFLGEWNWQFSNYSKNQSLVSAADRKGNRAIQGGGGGGRGRHGRRGRRRAPRKSSRRSKVGNDDDEQQTQAFNVAMATDGTFLFLHSSDYGLVRIGTGLNNTLRGHAYQHLIEFGKDESSNQLAYLAPFLYYRSDRTGQNILKLNPISLEQIEEINLNKTSGIHVNPDSPLIACHRYLYVIANYVPPTPATSFSLQAVSSDVAPVVRKKPEFQVLTLDPANNFAVVHKARLNNPALKSEHGDNEPSVALAKRNTETCNFCQRFHTLGNMFSSNFTSAWCGICFKRGYKPGENVRIRNADSATQTEFPSWYMPSISGQGPSPRFGHTAALVRGKKIQPEKEEDDEEEEEKTQSAPETAVATTESEETETNLIWIFGGGSGRPLQYNGANCTVDMAYNDLFVFDADNASWHTLTDIRGETPSSRMGHTCVVVDKKLYFFFGGKTDAGDDCHADIVHIFDTEVREWIKPLTSGAAPEPRLYCAAVLVGDDIIIHGGQGNNRVLTDAFSFNVKTNIWTQIKGTGVPPPNRYGHYLEVREDPLATDRNSITVFLIGGCGHDNQSNSQLPQFKIEMIPLKEKEGAATAATSSSASSSSNAPAATQYKYVWSTTNKVTVYHVMANAAYASIGDKTYVIGGYNQGSYMDRVSHYNFATNAWDELYMSSQTFKSTGCMAYATVDTKIYLFGGATETSASDSVMVLETSADPAVPLTQACLKDGFFYTNGTQLCMVLPPLLSPNVILAKQHMTRAFSLKSGEFEYDISCGDSGKPGNCAVYDPVNNWIWTFDAAKGTIRRWMNDDPAPLRYANIEEHTQLTVSNEPVQDLSLRLLMDLERFAIYSLPPDSEIATSFDSRRANFSSLRNGCLAHSETLNEPFSVEMNPQTFVLLAELLGTSVAGINERFADATARSFYTRAVETCLTLLNINLERLSTTLQFTLDSTVPVAGVNKRLGSVLFELLSALVVDAARWQSEAAKLEGGAALSSNSSFSTRYKKVITSTYGILSLGLPFFLSQQSARVDWFLDFLKNHLTDPAVKTDPTQAACLKRVLRQLIYHRRVTHDLLEPASDLEGSLPMQVVAVYEPKIVKSHEAGLSGDLGASRDDDEETAVEHILKDDDDVYVAQSSQLVHVVLSHRMRERLVQPTLVRVCLTSQPGNVAEVRGMRRARNVYNGLIFMLQQSDFDAVVSQTSQFDEFDEKRYNAWRKDKLAKKEAWDLTREPIGYFQFDSDADMKQKEKERLEEEKLAEFRAAYRLPSLDEEDSAELEDEGADPKKVAAPSASDVKKKKKMRELVFDPVWIKDDSGELVYVRAAAPYVLLKLLKAQAEQVKDAKKDQKKKKVEDEDEWSMMSVGPLAAPKKEAAAAPSTKASSVSTADEPCIMVKQVSVYGREPVAPRYIKENALKHLLPSSANAAPAAVLDNLTASSLGFPVLQLLLDRAAEYALADVKSVGSNNALSSSQAVCGMRLLQLLQTDLVSRGGKCLQTQPVSPLYSCLPPPAALLLQYTESMIEASISLLGAFASNIAGVESEDELRKRMDVLSQTFLRRQFLPLLTSMTFFADNVIFALRLLPSIVRLLQAFDRLSMNDSSSVSLTPLGKLFMKNEELYLANDDARLHAYALSSFNAATNACPTCGQSCASVSEYESHLVNEHFDLAKSKAVEIKAPWILDCQRSVASVAGRAAASLIRGPAVTRKEKQMQPWLECPIFSGGLELPDLLQLLKARRKTVRQLADSCSSGIVIASDDLFEPLETIESSTRSPLILEERAFIRAFLQTHSGATSPTATQPHAGIRLLSLIRVTLPKNASGQPLLPQNLTGWNVAQLIPTNMNPQQAAKQRAKERHFNPPIARAVNYARIALLKHLGLLKEAMWFADVLASQRGEAACRSVEATVGLELPIAELPANLRPVWLYTHLLHLWLLTFVPDLPSAAAIAEEEERKSKAEADEKKDPSASPVSPVAASPASSTSATLVKDPVIELSRGIIQRAICLLQTQSTFPLQSLSSTNVKGGADSGLAVPPILRSSSAWNPVDAASDELPPLAHQATVPHAGTNLTKSVSHFMQSSDEPAQVKEQRERALGDVVSMWKSLLSFDGTSNSNNSDRPPLTLQRQVSLSKKAASTDNKKNSRSNGHALLDYLIQFLKSDTDIDPVIAAEKEKAAAKKKKASNGSEADASDNKANEEDTVTFSHPHLLPLLLTRRHRAIMRAEGFRFVYQLLSTAPQSVPSAFLSVEEEIVKHLAAALRSEKDKDRVAELRPPAGTKLPVDAELEEEEEDDEFSRYSRNSKKKKGNDEDAAKADKNKPGFHYADDTFASGSRVSHHLSTTFQNLFGKLVTLLHVQVKAVLAKNESSPLSDLPSPIKGPVISATPSMSFDSLSLSLLASLGMTYTSQDHTFLDNSGLIHTIRKLMELETSKTAVVSELSRAAAKAASDSKAAVPRDSVSSQLKLKESGWNVFRLLALSGFSAQKHASVDAAPVSTVSTAATGQPQLTKFQVSLLELTFSIIQATSQSFLEKKQAQQALQNKVEEVDSEASTPVRKSSNSTNRSNNGDEEDGDFKEAKEEDDEQNLGSPSGSSPRGSGDDNGENDEDAPPEDEEKGGDEDPSANPEAVDDGGDGADSEDSSAALSLLLADAPGATCFSMLSLVLSMCGKSHKKSDKPGEEKLADKKKAEAPSDDSVLRYLSSSSRFLCLLIELLNHGTPRIQRMSIRLMRRLLPLCENPETLKLQGIESPTGSTLIPYFMHMIGNLLTSSQQSENSSAVAHLNAGKALSLKQKERYFRSADVSFSLASELITLLRILFGHANWTAPLKKAMTDAIQPLPSMLKKVDSISPDTPHLQLLVAALGVIGGYREMIRVGGKVHVFNAKNRKKRKVATVLAYDPTAATASVVFDSVATKSVEILGRGTCLVAIEEEKFDPSLLPLSESQAKPLIDAFRAVLNEVLKPTTTEEPAAPVASAGMSMMDSMASMESMESMSSMSSMTPSMLGLTPSAGSGSLIGLTPSSALSPTPGFPSTSPPGASPTVASNIVSTLPSIPLILIQLRSRALRALWNLLAHKASVHAVIRNGLGPILTQVAQLQTSIAISDTTSGKLEDTEKMSDKLAQVVFENGQLYSKPVLEESGSAFAAQSAAFPFNPYRSMVTLPTRMTSDDEMMVIEDADEGGHQLVTTGRVQAWEDEVPAWSNIPIPDEVPSFYFEVTIVNRSRDGSISVGFFPQTKKSPLGFPGQSRTPGGIGLFDNGYYQLGHVQHDVQWGPSASESARYWVDGDVIGVMHNRLTGFVSFCHNGLLKEDVVRLPLNRKYMPAVAVSDAGIRLYVNFGQKAFKFDFAHSKFVPKSLGGTMATEAHEIDAEVEAALKSSAANASASAATNRNALDDSPSGSPSGSSSKPDESDPVAAKKKALLEEAEKAEKAKVAAAAAAAQPEEKKEGEDEEKKEDGDAAGDESKAAGTSGAAGEEKSGENEEDDADPNAARRDAARREATSAVAESTSDSRFDPWTEEAEFEEEDDAADEDDNAQNSTDEEDQNDDNHPGYDEFGRRKRQKARVPPLTIDGIEIGMVVAIKSTGQSDGKKAKKRRNNNNGSSNKDKVVVQKGKLAGTVVQIDVMRRMVLLSVYQHESGLAHLCWFGIAAITRLKHRVNADLALKSEQQENVLQNALEHEHCLSVAYAKNALYAIITHSFQVTNKSSTGSSSTSLAQSDDSDVEFRLTDVGGPASLLAAVKRTALDESRDTSAKSASSSDSNEVEEEAVSSRPIDVLRRFVLQILRSSSSHHSEELADLVKADAIYSLKVGSDSSLSWVDRMKSKELVSYGCWLVDLLLSVATVKKVDPIDAHMKGKGAVGTKQQSSYVPTMPVFNQEVYNALVALLLPGRNLKTYKPTAIDNAVFPLLSRLITDVAKFNSSALPDLSKLEWLRETMNKRHDEEVKHYGSKETAVSKPLQAIINLVLCVCRAQEKIEATKKAALSSSSTANSLSLGPYSAAEEADPVYIGPDETSQTWFDKTNQVTQLMRGIEFGVGLPASFVRLAWLDAHLLKMAVSAESEHPYVNDKKWQEFIIPEAQDLIIRLDAKSRTDGSDKLNFAVLTSELNADKSAGNNATTVTPYVGAIKSEDLTEIATFSGSDMPSSGSGQFVVKGSTVEIKGFSRVFCSFTQSPSPVHPNIFCSACDFPIKGQRMVCVSCDGTDEGDSNGRRRRRRDERNGGYSLCLACENSNQDTNKHDRSHVFVVVNRPLPKSLAIPRVAPPASMLYSALDLQNIKNGNVKNVEQQKHVGVSCTGCGVSPIVGPRYKCSVCPSCDLCSNCLSSTTHDRSHPFFKLRHPVLKDTGFSGTLKSFIESTNEGDTFWGWRFTLTAKFSNTYLRSLLLRHKDEISQAIQSMRQYSSTANPGLDISMNAQCIEIINRAVTKLANINEKKGGGRGRGGRGRRDDDVSDNDATSDVDYLQSMLEPKSIVSSSKDLNIYSTLQNCSLEEVWMRMAVLKSLNTRLGGVLPLIDWSLVQHPWSLSYVFGKLRGLVFSKLKIQLWRAALNSSSSRHVRSRPVELDNHLASQARDMAQEWDVLDVVDATLFGQLFAQAGKWSADTLRSSGQAWVTKFKGESGYDAGGLFRDCLSKVCVDLQSDHVPLLIPCPNQRSGVGITLDKYVPNPSSTGAIWLQMYEFIGRLMGIAIRTGNNLELDLPSLVWKPLVGQELEVGDLTAIDQICVNAMNLICDEKAMAEKGINEENFEDAYGFDFTYSNASGAVVEVKENGADIPVTWQNRHEYARLVLDFRLHELSTQVRAIRAGLTSVIPARFLSLLTWKELELEVCGQSEIDIEILKANTQYVSCSQNDKHIQFFWAVLTSFSQLERAQFLRFSWGRSRLPSSGKFSDKMRIDSSGGHDITHLPVAHTCFFSIELPRYTTEEMMRDKLTKAITFCTSMELI